MIYALLKLHGLAQQRGDGLLPELAEGLRKMPGRGDGPLVVIVGGDGKGVDTSKVEQTSSSDGDKARKAG
jgi:hypothetical protein